MLSMNSPSASKGPAFVLGGCLIVCAAILAWSLIAARSGETISATGSARMAVTSDIAKWTINLNRESTVDALKAANAAMTADSAEVQSFLAASGIPKTAVDVSPIFMDQIFRSERDTGPQRFTLRRKVTVTLPDPAKLQALASSLQPLIDKGVAAATGSLEFTYSKLPEARVSLLGDAVKDARARAEQIAASGGAKVGKLKNARLGVTQVLAPNSMEVSDFGTYDTSSIPKEIMVTVKAEFGLR